MARCQVNGMEFCPQCYSNAKGRSNYPDHTGYRPASKEQVKMSRFKSKADLEKTSPAPAGHAAVVVGLADECPTLWDYLATDRCEDGTPRQTSTLSLFVGPGGLQAALNDRERGLVCFVTGTSVPAILFALEDMLAADSADWRRAKGGRNQK